jgi:predicted nucleic acid-binding Zn ribbon protein
LFYDYFCECEAIKEDVVHGMTEEPEILCDICGKRMKRIVTGGTMTVFKDQHGYTRGTTFSEQKPTHSVIKGTAVNNDLKKAMADAGEDGLVKGNMF